MCIRRRTLMVWGMVIVLAAFFVGVLGMPNTARPASAQVDWCERLRQEFSYNLNRGNWADDMVFTDALLCDQVECVGKDAYRVSLGHWLALNAQYTITSCEVSGNTVAVTYEIAYDATRAAGVDRIIASVAYEFQDDEIVAARSGSLDLTDPQMAQLIEYSVTRPRPTFEMGPGRDADQSPGMVEMPGYPDFVGVLVRITPGPAGVPQPINIHEGTCANLGGVAISLEDVGGGLSITILRDVSLSDLQTGNHAIAVQQSEAEPDVYVACGDIPAAEEEPEILPAPAPVIVPAPAIAPATGSGGLLADEGSSAAFLWYTLASVGIVLVVVGLAGLHKVRSRR